MQSLSSILHNQDTASLVTTLEKIFKSNCTRQQISSVQYLLELVDSSPGLEAKEYQFAAQGKGARFRTHARYNALSSIATPNIRKLLTPLLDSKLESSVVRSSVISWLSSIKFGYPDVATVAKSKASSTVKQQLEKMFSTYKGSLIPVELRKLCPSIKALDPVTIRSLKSTPTAHSYQCRLVYSNHKDVAYAVVAQVQYTGEWTVTSVKMTVTSYYKDKPKGVKHLTKTRGLFSYKSTTTTSLPAFSSKLQASLFSS